MSDNLEIDDFAAHVGTRFVVRGTPTPTEFELVSVEPLPASGLGARDRPFSLMFEAESPEVVPQATHNLSHDYLGELALFLVPLGPDPQRGRMRYEAVFT